MVFWQRTQLSSITIPAGRDVQYAQTCFMLNKLFFLFLTSVFCYSNKHVQNFSLNASSKKLLWGYLCSCQQKSMTSTESGHDITEVLGIHDTYALSWGFTSPIGGFWGSTTITKQQHWQKVAALVNTWRGHKNDEKGSWPPVSCQGLWDGMHTLPCLC